MESELDQIPQAWVETCRRLPWQPSCAPWPFSLTSFAQSRAFSQEIAWWLRWRWCHWSCPSSACTCSDAFCNAPVWVWYTCVRTYQIYVVLNVFEGMRTYLLRIQLMKVKYIVFKIRVNFNRGWNWAMLLFWKSTVRFLHPSCVCVCVVVDWWCSTPSGVRLSAALMLGHQCSASNRSTHWLQPTKNTCLLGNKLFGSHFLTHPYEATHTHTHTLCTVHPGKVKHWVIICSSQLCVTSPAGTLPHYKETKQQRCVQLHSSTRMAMTL